MFPKLLLVSTGTQTILAGISTYLATAIGLVGDCLTLVGALGLWVVSGGLSPPSVVQLGPHHCSVAQLGPGSCLCPLVTALWFVFVHLLPVLVSLAYIAALLFSLALALIPDQVAWSVPSPGMLVGAECVRQQSALRWPLF